MHETAASWFDLLNRRGDVTPESLLDEDIVALCQFGGRSGPTTRLEGRAAVVESLAQLKHDDYEFVALEERACAPHPELPPSDESLFVTYRIVVDTVLGLFENRGEMILRHTHEGVDLKHDYAHATLRSLHKVWRRPVGIETVVEGVPTRIIFDGSEVKEERI